MSKTKDLSGLSHYLAYQPLHFYFETLEDGTQVLRHIRVQQRTFEVPADGITIDTVPPNSVGTDEIVDGSIRPEDMSDDVRDRLTPKYDEQAEGIKLGTL